MSNKQNDVLRESLQDTLGEIECVLCGDEFKDDLEEDDDIIAEINSIKEYGRCLGCVEEWGEEWPDRI